jgi:RNA polymerase sigma-70 factor (ECF subfamily)
MTKAGACALEPPSGPDNADRALESRAVADALRSLLPEHRGVLLETYYHGRTVAEAAAVLGTTAGTVKFRTLAALRALNLALQARGSPMPAVIGIVPAAARAAKADVEGMMG